MKRIIHPFVGTNYCSGGLQGTKILILGESSYHPGGHPDGYDISRQTINVGEDAIGYDEGRGYWNKSRFYTRIARMFGFNPLSYNERRDFWNSVSYYNYLQAILLAPRVIPPANLWEDAKEPFVETLAELRPDFVLCFSKRMWQHLPKTDDEDIPNLAGIYAKQAKFQYSEQSAVKLFSFKHPTAPSFCWQDVRSILNEHIQFQRA